MAASHWSAILLIITHSRRARTTTHRRQRSSHGLRFYGSSRTADRRPPRILTHRGQRSSHSPRQSVLLIEIIYVTHLILALITLRLSSFLSLSMFSFRIWCEMCSMHNAHSM
ncbi:uncharacterized protein LOC126890508 [Diabrotica virgifera virgifera]|uniref:Secreted protein n=1 Tax=Diabrotica virgifera virgifera TaxID=50390 RepID=A0ABM5KZ48_DIAVI|nr:uncharacterized protein LOC126890508 [Diabrotica virgifera virgifera]